MSFDAMSGQDSDPTETKKPSDEALRRLRGLFPELSEDEFKDVAETLNRYCSTVWRIYERLKQEHPEVIDELMRNRTMKAKVDSSEQTQTT